MKEKRFVPLNKNVLLEEAKVGTKIEDENGFVISEVTDGRTIPEGIVIAVDSEVERLEKGETAVFNSNHAYKFLFNGKEYLLTNFENIFGKIV